jgi:hypothetical protein
MATRSAQLPLRTRVRSRIGVALAVLVIVGAAVVLASQASSIWAHRTPATVSPRTDAVTLPVFVHPGANRGQVRVGRFEPNADPIRAHGPAQRPKWGE